MPGGKQIQLNTFRVWTHDCAQTNQQVSVHLAETGPSQPYCGTCGEAFTRTEQTAQAVRRVYWRSTYTR